MITWLVLNWKVLKQMVRLSEAPIIIIEGDEYLSSPIDRRPKFLWYHPHIAIISGIAWDHVNVFPTFNIYLEQFKKFIQSVDPEGSLIYCIKDKTLSELIHSHAVNLNLIPYQEHQSSIENGTTYLKTDKEVLPIQIFGTHNLENLMAAMHVCLSIGVSKDQFYSSIQSFKGAAKRLELIAKSGSTLIYKDYAHSPSKLKATTTAVKKQYPNKNLIACMELHTFSSLTSSFLNEYSGSMNDADQAIVYFNPKAITHKGLKELTIEEVKEAFLPSKVQVFNKSDLVKSFIEKLQLDNAVLLLMTSGNFDGINLNELGKQLTNSN